MYGKDKQLSRLLYSNQRCTPVSYTHLSVQFIFGNLFSILNDASHSLLSLNPEKLACPIFIADVYKRQEFVQGIQRAKLGDSEYAWFLG